MLTRSYHNCAISQCAAGAQAGSESMPASVIVGIGLTTAGIFIFRVFTLPSSP